MPTNLDRYKKGLDALAAKGTALLQAMIIESDRSESKKIKKGDEKNLPDFRVSYQPWYSEALECVSQLLPERKADFINYYKPDRVRKEILYGNYTISDYLQGLTVTRGYQKDIVVEPSAAVPMFHQQLQIVEAMKRRLESSLFDI